MSLVGIRSVRSRQEILVAGLAIFSSLGPQAFFQRHGSLEPCVTALLLTALDFKDNANENHSANCDSTFVKNRILLSASYSYRSIVTENPNAKIRQLRHSPVLIDTREPRARPPTERCACPTSIYKVYLRVVFDLVAAVVKTGGRTSDCRLVSLTRHDSDGQAE